MGICFCCIFFKNIFTYIQKIPPIQLNTSQVEVLPAKQILAPDIIFKWNGYFAHFPHSSSSIVIYYYRKTFWIYYLTLHNTFLDQHDINQSEKSNLNDFHLETKEILLHKKLVNLGVFKRRFIMLIIIFFTLDILWETQIDINWKTLRWFLSVVNVVHCQFNKSSWRNGL